MSAHFFIHCYTQFNICRRRFHLIRFDTLISIIYRFPDGRSAAQLIFFGPLSTGNSILLGDAAAHSHPCTLCLYRLRRRRRRRRRRHRVINILAHIYNVLIYVYIILFGEKQNRFDKRDPRRTSFLHE